jgi:hypothetical protein
MVMRPKELATGRKDMYLHHMKSTAGYRFSGVFGEEIEAAREGESLTTEQAGIKGKSISLVTPRALCGCSP